MDAGRYWRVVVATAFVGATWETRLRVTGLEAKVTAAAAAVVGEEGSFGRCAVLTGTRPWLRGGDTEVVMC